MTIRECELPDDAFLRRYHVDGGYTDCFVTTVPGHIPRARYVEAFYTTWLFKAERIVLALAGHTSSDADAAALAREDAAAFSAWRVEDRNEDQLLMSDVSGRTRSWVGVAASSGDEPSQTSLYFGSAIISATSGREGPVSIGPVFRALTGFHTVYSKALLKATRRSIVQPARQVQA
ncbi:MAG: hypothetical protein ACNA7O_16390 [Rhodobacterales bacterium]